MPSAAFGIAIAELVYYIPTLLPALFCFWTHRRTGIFGWFFFCVFVLQQIFGAVLTLGARSHDDLALDGSLLRVAGIAPLILAFCGFVHEWARVTDRVKTKLMRIAWYIYIVTVWIVVGFGVTLHAIGSGIEAVNAALQICGGDYGLDLAITGVILLLVTYLILLVLFCVLGCRAGNGTFKTMHWAIAVGFVILGARIIYATVMTILRAMEDSPGAGNSALKVLFEFLPGALIVAIMITAGVITHRAARHEKETGPVSTAPVLTV